MASTACAARSPPAIAVRLVTAASARVFILSRGICSSHRTVQFGVSDLLAADAFSLCKTIYITSWTNCHQRDRLEGRILPKGGGPWGWFRTIRSRLRGGAILWPVPQGDWQGRSLQLF